VNEILVEFGHERACAVEGLRPAASLCALYAFVSFRDILAFSVAVASGIFAVV
jgi:hypothetical protein